MEMLYDGGYFNGFKCVKKWTIINGTKIVASLTWSVIDRVWGIISVVLNSSNLFRSAMLNDAPAFGFS